MVLAVRISTRVTSMAWNVVKARAEEAGVTPAEYFRQAQLTARVVGAPVRRKTANR